MSNMGLKTTITYIFYITCIVFALYMTYRQIAIYCANEDSSSVQYSSFSGATENYYPDITICLADYQPGAQFNESRLPYNITSVELTNMLLGAETERSKTKEKDKTFLQLILEFI